MNDSKLRWLPERQAWLCMLACGDHLRSYSNPGLQRWTLERAFGVGVGAHGGVWKCPDLLPLSASGGRRHRVPLVSLTPDGANKGLATQCFIGDFDGHRLIPYDTRMRWLDLGPDNCTGVTWASVDDLTLFIG